MKVRNTMRVGLILFATILALAGWTVANAQGQNASHVVSQKEDHAVTPGQLRQDVQKVADARQANEAAVREMFASDQARETLKSAGIDYRQVNQAISQVSDEDLTRMAQRAQEVNKNFAAGRMDDRDLLIILLIAVAIIIIIVAAR